MYTIINDKCIILHVQLYTWIALYKKGIERVNKQEAHGP